LTGTKKNPYAVSVAEDMYQNMPLVSSSIENGTVKGFSDKVSQIHPWTMDMEMVDFLRLSSVFSVDDSKYHFILSAFQKTLEWRIACNLIEYMQ
jgi:hypothetical protein